MSMKKKICICTPNYSSMMHSDYVLNIMQNILDWKKKYEVTWFVYKRTFICKARNEMVINALNWGADYILWYDDDAIVDPDTLDRMIERDKDIVIAPYPMRTPPYQCGVLVSKTGDFEDQFSYRNLTWDEMNNGLIEVDGGGTHCMLTKASVYLTIQYPWFSLPMLGGTEDMYFCLIAKRRGIKIYCDSDIKTGHIGFPEIVTTEHAKLWTSKYGNQTLGEVRQKKNHAQFIDADHAIESSVGAKLAKTLENYLQPVDAVHLKSEDQETLHLQKS